MEVAEMEKEEDCLLDCLLINSVALYLRRREENGGKRRQEIPEKRRNWGGAHLSGGNIFFWPCGTSRKREHGSMETEIPRVIGRNSIMERNVKAPRGHSNFRIDVQAKRWAKKGSRKGKE